MRALVRTSRLRDGFRRLLPGDDRWGSEFGRVLIVARESGLELTARSEDGWSRTVVSAEVSEPGQALIPLKPMRLATGRFIVEELELRVSRNSLFAKAKSSNARFACVPDDEWISPPGLDDSAIELGTEWHSALLRVASAAHASDQIYRGIRFGDGHILASDHYTVAVLSTDFGLEPFAIVADVLKHALRDADGPLYITVGHSVVRFRLSESEVWARRLEVPPGDLSRVIRTDGHYHMTIDRRTLAHAISLASSVSLLEDASPLVHLRSDGRAGLEVWCQARDLGRVSAKLRYEGNFDGHLTFHFKHLTKVIESALSDDITLQISSESKPVIVRDNALTHAIMPTINRG